MLNIDQSFIVCGVIPSIALFDPEVVAHHTNDEDTEWWNNGYHKLDEVQQGKISLIETQDTEFFELRITSGDLTDKEKENIYKGSNHPICANTGFEVISNQLFIGCVSKLPHPECRDILDLSLPTNTNQAHLQCEDGRLISLANGAYNVTAYAIDNEHDDTLPCLVLVIKTRTEPFSFNGEEPRLEWCAW